MFNIPDKNERSLVTPRASLSYLPANTAFRTLVALGISPVLSEYYLTLNIKRTKNYNDIIGIGGIY